MIDVHNWYALAGDSLERTTDSGSSWKTVGALPDNACCWLSFADMLHGWTYSSSGTSGTLYGTTDGGGHWTELQAPARGADFSYYPNL